ncbi:hypothetical protein ACHAWO_010102 [Cyclotella atomus]|uniref:Uncharacterized protein n=1 Tax=Cyclotella atomus TaxID=382360 RepID=A0ABD3QRW1_9STRA
MSPQMVDLEPGKEVDQLDRDRQHRKQTSAIAIQGAAAALDDRMSDLRRSKNFNTMMKLTEEGCAEEDLEVLDGQLVMFDRLVQEVERLEKLLGYDEKSTGDASSSSSSSSGGNDDNDSD